MRPNRVQLLYAITMADTPPKKTARKKPGKPLRFPERVLVYVTEPTKKHLQALADERQLLIPDVVRTYIREGLERDGIPVEDQ